MIFNFSKLISKIILSISYRNGKVTSFEGLNFSIPCKKLDYTDYLVKFEVFFREIRNLDILSNEDMDFVKAKTKEGLLLSYTKMCLKIFLLMNSLLYKSSL